MTVISSERSVTGAAIQRTDSTMKALVYHRPGKRAWEEKPHPTVKEPGDAVVRVTTTTICGTDLHILKGIYRPWQTAALSDTKELVWCNAGATA